MELRIITEPYAAVYWGYFGGLVFGNSLTKHNKLSSFSYSVVIFSLPLSHIPPCYHVNLPDFPRLIGPRDLGGFYSVAPTALIGYSRVKCCWSGCPAKSLSHSPTSHTWCIHAYNRSTTHNCGHSYMAVVCVKFRGLFCAGERCRRPLSFYSFDHVVHISRGSNRHGKLGVLAWKQGGMWENVNEFPKTKRRNYSQYASEWWCVIMCKSKRPFIPANDYSEFISL